MSNITQSISLFNLFIATLPGLLVVGIFFFWSLDYKNALQAMARMLIQLMLIGYVLQSIFFAQQSWIILLVLLFMLSVSTWISLNTVKQNRWSLYPLVFVSILAGGGGTLVLITQVVLNATPWYQPQIMIPLAGMIFANSLTSISLALERYFSEREQGKDYIEARNTAYRTAMIPVTNALLAVGVVSLPGMMTGQILSGVSPLIAARYQIMVMLMVFSAAGISSALLLTLLKNKEAL